MRSRPGGGTFHIEDVQDQVELGLMRGGHHEVARAYVLYRERRAQERAAQKTEQAAPAQPTLHVLDGGQKVALDLGRLQALIATACANLGADVKPEPIVAETMRNLYAPRSRPTPTTPTPRPACCCIPSSRKCWARK
jgi:ribonucleoside-diphosphate reductase alpha chain